MNQRVKPLIFHDVIYQKVTIEDPLIQSLIYTPEFQRLKYLRQLGTLSLTINASAAHTRFTHCLGVYHLIHSLFTRTQFSHLSLQEKREVEIAGLLHDLGHGPFSHIFEKVVPRFVHEEYSAKLIYNPQGNIYSLLSHYKLNIDRIVNLILHRLDHDWAQTLISGQFDLDRLDYLLRDRYFVGLSSSGINLDRLLDNIFLCKNKIVFQEEALLDLENYLIFRFYMHKTFFWNPENVFLDNLFVTIFKRLKLLFPKNQEIINSFVGFDQIAKNKLPNISTFLQMTDYSVLSFFSYLQNHINDPILQKLITVFLHPSHPHPYLLDFSEEDIKKGETKNWSREYFYYQNHFSLDLYKENNQIIWIWTNNQQCQKLSEVSMFFNQNRSYQKDLAILLKI